MKNMEPLWYNQGMSVHVFVFLSHLLISCCVKKARKKNVKGHRQCNKNGAIVVISNFSLPENCCRTVQQ